MSKKIYGSKVVRIKCVICKSVKDTILSNMARTIPETCQDTNCSAILKSKKQIERNRIKKGIKK